MRSLPGAWVMSSHRTMTWSAGILKKACQRGDGVARKVHVGQGLEQHHLVAVHFALTPQALKFGLADRDAPLGGQSVQRGKARVVAGAVVFGFRVAEAGNEPDVVCSCHGVVLPFHFLLK